MDEGSLEKTAFTTYSGLYKFNVMLFKLCNAPVTFQRLMETVLAGLTQKICMDYINDILVFIGTFEDHLSHLKQVMDKFHRTSTVVKTLLSIFFLALKQASRSITGRLWWLQLLCPTYHTHKQTCTSFTGFCVSSGGAPTPLAH